MLRMALRICFLLLLCTGGILSTPVDTLDTSTSQAKVTSESTTSTTTEPSTTTNGKSRALETPSSNSTTKEKPLDDVSMDEGKQECVEGKKIEEGCDRVCTCKNGKNSCSPRCEYPLVRSSITLEDPHCHLKSTEDHCCSLTICTHGNEEESCTYKNATYNYGEQFNDSCEAICKCGEKGEVSCKPRCPPVLTHLSDDRCLELPDENDACCKKVFCDVNSSDDSANPDEGMHHLSFGPDEEMHLNLISVEPINSTGVVLTLDQADELEKIQVEVSLDQKSWTKTESKGEEKIIVNDISPGKTYFFRVSSGKHHSNVMSASLTGSESSKQCEFKGKTYKYNEKFYDECSAYCQCSLKGVVCATIECPTQKGLELLDAACLEWEKVDFDPSPPNCCPKTVKCKNKGTCPFEGETFENGALIPSDLTGCDKVCHCEAGKVSCSSRGCPPVPAQPPSSLPCPPGMAQLISLPDDKCCHQWVCTNNGLRVHQGIPPGLHQLNTPDRIIVHSLEVHGTTVRLIFSVPRVFVGLKGRVKLRYTADKNNNDPSKWEQQILAPPDDLIATPELEFELGGLLPDTEYKIRITLEMEGTHNTPTSEIFVVKTHAEALPPIIAVEPDLHVIQLNSTWATLGWRKFTDFELQFIDGVQLRYKELDGKVYQATPLIHRAVTTYRIEDLKPESKYEVGIFFIPFFGQTTELQAQKSVQLSTTMENDPYKFELAIDIYNIKSTSVEVTWTGVPYPEDKYVNIYRVIYQSETGREDYNSFKVAKRDSTSTTSIEGLLPETRYRLWIEAYLTNGRTKKSNVKDFTTRIGVAEQANASELERTAIVESTDYYGPLVGVSIFACIAILSNLALILLLVRKHGHNKAPITAVHRKTPQHATPYDNPSYQVENQHETLGMQTLSK